MGKWFIIPQIFYVNKHSACEGDDLLHEVLAAPCDVVVAAAHLASSAACLRPVNTPTQCSTCS